MYILLLSPGIILFASVTYNVLLCLFRFSRGAFAFAFMKTTFAKQIGKTENLQPVDE